MSPVHKGKTGAAVFSNSVKFVDRVVVEWENMSIVNVCTSTSKWFVIFY